MYLLLGELFRSLYLKPKTNITLPDDTKALKAFKTAEHDTFTRLHHHPEVKRLSERRDIFAVTTSDGSAAPALRIKVIDSEVHDVKYGPIPPIMSSDDFPVHIELVEGWMFLHLKSIGSKLGSAVTADGNKFSYDTLGPMDGASSKIIVCNSYYSILFN